MGRIEAREIAFKLLFELSFDNQTPPEGYSSLFEEMRLNDADLLYIQSVLDNFKSNKILIDGKISAKLVDWTPERLPRTDMAILRLAVCEMLFIEDVPPKASIDQAVELAKKYCNDKSPSYINGILDACYKEL